MLLLSTAGTPAARHAALPRPQVPQMAFGEYWDTCEYSDGVLNYNQVGSGCGVPGLGY